MFRLLFEGSIKVLYTFEIDMCRASFRVLKQGLLSEIEMLRVLVLRVPCGGLEVFGSHVGV